MSGERAARRLGLPARLALGAAILLVLVLAAGVFLYLDRLDLARHAALAWLRNQGVEGEIQVRSLGPTRLKAKVRLGPEAHPDVTVDEAVVDYSLDSFLRGKGLAVSAIRLNRPELHAAWRGGKLQLGSLDRLAQALKPQPGAPPAPPPRIEVRAGRVLLATDYNLLRVDGDAVLEHGRLQSLEATMVPQVIRAREDLMTTLGGASIRAHLSGDRLRLGVQLTSPQTRLPQGRLSDSRANLQADLSYAALEQGLVEGGLSGDISVATVIPAQVQGEAHDLQLAVQWPQATVDLKASKASGSYHLRAAISDLDMANAALAVAAEGNGRLSLDKASLAADFTGGLSGSGAYEGLEPVTRTDAPVMAAVKRAAKRFRFDVGKAALSLDHGRFSAKLLTPARAISASGGALGVRPVGRGYAVTLAGGGLPEAEADIRRLGASSGAIVAEGGVKAAFSLGLLDRATVKSDGRLTVRGGTAAFAAFSCADVAVKRLDFADNSADDFTAKLCPTREPLLTASGDRWAIAGQARDASAKVPSFEVALSRGEGAVRLHGRGQDLGAEFAIDRVEAKDLAKPLRFHPVVASGRATLARDVFSGGLNVRTPEGVQLAHADFHDAVTAMKGGMTISAPAVTFAKGGLQPTQLSPLTAALGEPASGKVSFEGRFDWTGDKTTSNGRLTVDNLSFRSPAGPVTGMSGAMAFTSLAPLVGASVGPFKAERIAGIVPLTDVSALAKVENETATVTDGQGSVGGGKVRLQATASLGKDQTVQGRVSMEGVQVHDLVASSPFSDKVSLTAQVSGALPFRMTAGKLRISAGAAQADGPGRLSISRATFNPGGAANGPATRDNLSTFGYQAMEHLAFKSLTATIDSQADGKLRMVFHIAGKYDPPTKKELRLTWRDILDRKVLNKSMPLPSNTEVNLTLDTTLNLDNLIESQGIIDRQLGSASVQTQGATFGADTAKGPQ